MSSAYRVEITSRALRDLTGIYQRIEAATRAGAARWFDGMEKAINRLETHPNRAPATPEDPHVTAFAVRQKAHVYRIIYEIEEDTSTVYVLHIRSPGRATNGKALNR